MGGKSEWKVILIRIMRGHKIYHHLSNATNLWAKSRRFNVEIFRILFVDPIAIHHPKDTISH